MGKPIDAAANAVGDLIVPFVEAADRLVNLLTRERYDEAEKDAAMNAYDIARRNLTGEHVSSA